MHSRETSKINHQQISHRYWRPKVFCLLGLLAITPAWAGIIEFQANDLSSPGGQNRWRYDYYVSGFDFTLDAGFSIVFQWKLYKDLSDPPPPVNADWDTSVVERDFDNQDDGTYDAFALTDTPSLADIFSVSFTWLGTGVPSAQPYEIYDDTFTVIDTGTTVPYAPAATPLPPSIGLFGLGLMLLLPTARRRTS